MPEREQTIRTMIEQTLGEEEFKSPIAFRHYKVQVATVTDQRMRKALLAYLESIDYDQSSPVDNRNSHFTSQVNFVDDTINHDQYTQQKSDFQTFLRYHSLGQRIMEIVPEMGSATPTYELDDRVKGGGTYCLALRSGADANRVRALLATMAKDAGMRVTAIRQVGKISTDNEDMLSAHIPMRSRSLLIISETMLTWINSLNDMEFEEAFLSASARTAQRPITR